MSTGGISIKSTLGRFVVRQGYLITAVFTNNLVICIWLKIYWWALRAL